MTNNEIINKATQKKKEQIAQLIQNVKEAKIVKLSIKGKEGKVHHYYYEKGTI